METKHKVFKPFDKVLVKRDHEDEWTCDFYSHYDKEHKWHVIIKNYSISDAAILPYEGNEYLVGTTDDPDEEVKLEAGEWLMASDFISSIKDMFVSACRYSHIRGDRFFLDSKARLMDYKYAIRFSDFNPNDMEKTRKHILCVKNGKVVRYKPE